MLPGEIFFICDISEPNKRNISALLFYHAHIYNIRESIGKAINVIQEMNTKNISETNLLIYATDANALIRQFPRVNHSCNVDFNTLKFSINLPLKDLTRSIHRSRDVSCVKGSWAMTHS